MCTYQPCPAGPPPMKVLRPNGLRAFGLGGFFGCGRICVLSITRFAASWRFTHPRVSAATRDRCQRRLSIHSPAEGSASSLNELWHQAVLERSYLEVQKVRTRLECLFGRSQVELRVRRADRHPITGAAHCNTVANSLRLS